MGNLVEAPSGIEILDTDRTAEMGGVMLRFANLNGGPEIFYTVQGEGRNTGMPTVFSRLVDCNLWCGRCDTAYTWNWEGTPYTHEDGVKYDREEQTIELGIGEAADRVTDYPCNRLVITGGEPLLQRRALVPFIDELHRRDPRQWIEMETNGTIPPGAALTERVNQFNVSPKLATMGAGIPLDRRRRRLALAAFAAIPHADFKFVAANKADVTEIDEIVDTYDIPHRRVYLMPEGRTPEEVTTGQRKLVEVCKDRGYNLTTRLHVLIWGAKKGV